MVVSGVPSLAPIRAEALAALALDMRDACPAVRMQRAALFPVRIGHRGGPVVAVVVWAAEFFLRVWGDAVTPPPKESTGWRQLSGGAETYERPRTNSISRTRRVDVKWQGDMRLVPFGPKSASIV